MSIFSSNSVAPNPNHENRQHMMDTRIRASPGHGPGKLYFRYFNYEIRRGGVPLAAAVIVPGWRGVTTSETRSGPHSIVLL